MNKRQYVDHMMVTERETEEGALKRWAEDEASPLITVREKL